MKDNKLALLMTDNGRSVATYPPCTPIPHKKDEKANHTKAELIAEILREYERYGDAMRYLDHMGRGKRAWMLARLADAEREAEDDMEDLP